MQLFSDNLYMSIPMALEFMKYKIFCTGTIRANRLYLPDSIKVPPKLTCGQYILMQSVNCPQLTAVVWQDTRTVRYVSVGANPTEPDVEVNRRSAGRYIEVSQPYIGQLYAKHMSSIDKMNFFKEVYSILRRSRHWPMYIFYWCMQVILSNSFVLFMSKCRGLKKTYSMVDFRLELAKQLIGNYTFQKYTLAQQEPARTLPAFANHPCTRMDAKHVKACRMHKKFHGHGKRTVYGCRQCSMHLCDMCFTRFHTQDL